MRGADPVLRAGTAGGVVERVQLHAEKDVHAATILVLKAADLGHVGVPVHMDVLIHVTREAKSDKPGVIGCLGHLARRVPPVAERRVRMEVGVDHAVPLGFLKGFSRDHNSATR